MPKESDSMHVERSPALPIMSSIETPIDSSVHQSCGVNNNSLRENLFIKFGASAQFFIETSKSYLALKI